MDSDTDRDLVGPGEAAKMLGVSRSTLHRYTVAGWIPGIHRLPSGQVRYHRLTITALRRMMADGVWEPGVMSDDEEDPGPWCR